MNPSDSNDDDKNKQNNPNESEKDDRYEQLFEQIQQNGEGFQPDTATEEIGSEKVISNPQEMESNYLKAEVEHEQFMKTRETFIEIIPRKDMDYNLKILKQESDSKYPQILNMIKAVMRGIMLNQIIDQTTIEGFVNTDLYNYVAAILFERRYVNSKDQRMNPLIFDSFFKDLFKFIIFMLESNLPGINMILRKITSQRQSFYERHSIEKHILIRDLEETMYERFVRDEQDRFE